MTRRSLLLQALRDAGPQGVTTGQLVQLGAGNRFGARLRELREMGHRVEARRIRDGQWSYRLTWDQERGRGWPVVEAASPGVDAPRPLEDGRVPPRLSDTLFPETVGRPGPAGPYTEEAA